ncbi:sterol desaturase family protein [Pontibacter sp. G13]|uniref:sterol desaturase family protein n=1 Tax=Pontibacter sp. G13 TaxID=3074898 RepID=UPI00288AD9DB|nr:sterol desaturase family protein [Pontibacter sp. G13]WNJ19450.1 sterol desaturase family protein [Pontibacter sp. G13]
METYAQALIYAIPGFMVLLLIEFVYGYAKKDQKIKSLDTISSLSSGVTNIIKDVLGLTFVILSYDWVVHHISLFEVKELTLSEMFTLENLWIVLIAFIAKDFAGYWSHYLNHKVNYFWNHHIVHHSSEEFNLACALRQSISEIFSLYTFFLLPAALLGVPSNVIAVIAPIHLFLQFWYHTQYIGKLGLLEWIIVTPSQHRVHHAINPEYMDKNFGQIFIIWDRMFGTFQEELDDQPPVYGVKRPVRTWNPILIGYQHLWLLMQDAWRTRSWWDKLRIWFMPTGWRPADVVERYPVFAVEDVYTLEKYEVKTTRAVHLWSWFQFLTTVAIMFHMFLSIGAIKDVFDLSGLIVFGLFLYLSIFALTALMDLKRYSLWVEMLKSALGFAVIGITGDWFLLGESNPFLLQAFMAYLVISPLMVAWLNYRDLPQSEIVGVPVAA